MQGSRIRTATENHMTKLRKGLRKLNVRRLELLRELAEIDRKIAPKTRQLDRMVNG